MKKPYARSTLKQKYKETGLDPRLREKARAYLTACANFYKIIEAKDAWKVFGDQCGITREELSTLLAIFARDDSMPFYVERESELYGDGSDELLLIDKEFLIKPNEEFDSDEFLRCIQDEKPYDGPEMFDEDWDIFFELDQKRAGKPLYIPSNILRYADEKYVEETAQVTAMRQFLEKELKFDVKESFLPYLLEDAEPARGKAADIRKQASAFAIREMNSMICDICLPPDKALSLELESLKELGYRIRGAKQLQRFADLFSDMNNHTRMPSNRGYTPYELMQRSGGGALPRLEFGPGLQASIQSGELDGPALKLAIMGEEDLPLDVRENLLREVDRALSPAAGSAPARKEKIRPNDPCPCGSGKKYKKCCGAKDSF